MFVLSLLAQAGRPSGSPFDRPEILWASAGLAGALLVGAVVIYLVDRWRKQAQMRDRQAGTELTSFRAMYERGEITEEEYTRLRQKVADRVKPSPAAPPGAPPSVSTPTPNPAQPPIQPPVAGPFPPGYFDDPEGPKPPPASPNGPASGPAGGGSPPA